MNVFTFSKKKLIYHILDNLKVDEYYNDISVFCLGALNTFLYVCRSRYMKPEVLNNGQIWFASHIGFHQRILPGFYSGF